MLKNSTGWGRLLGLPFSLVTLGKSLGLSLASNLSALPEGLTRWASRAPPRAAQGGKLPQSLPRWSFPTCAHLVKAKGCLKALSSTSLDMWPYQTPGSSDGDRPTTTALPRNTFPLAPVPK